MQMVFRQRSMLAAKVDDGELFDERAERAEALSSVTICTCVANGRVYRRMTFGSIAESSFFAAPCMTPSTPARTVH